MRSPPRWGRSCANCPDDRGAVELLALLGRMKCPVDGATLSLSERSGVEIDYCPECRGVWLDRSELDKIIERSAEAPAPPRDDRRRDDDRDDRRDDDRRYDDRRYDDRRYDDRRYDDRGRKPYRKKRESWLGELFD